MSEILKSEAGETMTCLPEHRQAGFQSLRHQLEMLQFTKQWRPKPGDLLIGTLEGAVPRTGPFGHGHQLMLRDEQDTTWRLWLTAYLKSQLEGYSAKRGDLVGVKYLGKGVSGKGAQYNRYEVLVHRQTGRE